MVEVHDIVQETGIKNIPMEKKCIKAKWLSGDALQIAVKTREAKSKGEKERYSHLNAEFQRITRKDKKAFLKEQLVSQLVQLVQSVSSVTQSCLTFCDPMSCSRPGLPVHHQLLEFTQTHVHWVSDAIQSPHPLSSTSRPSGNPSRHQGLFK